VSFLNCSLKGATLNNANLNDADFDGAVLTGATIRGTILGNASFEGAVLTGVDLSDLAVARERLKRCIMDPPPEARTRLPLLVANLASAQSWVESGGRQGGPANLEREDIRLLGRMMKCRKLTRMNCSNTLALDILQLRIAGRRF
jgi:uncharacterized protein YjbI with pentapeptide repeats